ncbi:MAG: TIGR01458 family HAD-type hydrolase [Acidobacteriota bacterium]
MPPVNPIRGVLLDLDGTLYTEEGLIPGAASAVGTLRAEGLPLRLVTNATTKHRSTIQAAVEKLGLAVDVSEIFSAPFAAARWLSDFPEARVWVLTRGDSRVEFASLRQTTEDPDFIVLGDQMDRFSFEFLNEIFRKLRDGAELIALQKNRFWMTGGKLTLDAGPFICCSGVRNGKTRPADGKTVKGFLQFSPGRPPPTCGSSRHGWRRP